MPCASDLCRLILHTHVLVKDPLKRASSLIHVVGEELLKYSIHLDGRGWRHSASFLKRVDGWRGGG